MMIFLSISGLLNGISSLALGLFVFFKNRQNLVNRTYFYFTISVAIWGLGYFFWPLAKNKTDALNSFRLLHLGAVFITICYYHFASALTNRIKQNKKIILLGYLLATFFAISIPTKLFIKDMAPKFIFKFWATPGILYHFYLMFFFSYVVLAIYIIYKEFKKSSGIKRKQFTYILIASCLGYFGGSTNYPLWYNIPIYPVANILVTFYVAITAYAIVKYRMMDVKVAITRTGIFIAVYSLILGLPFVVAVKFKNLLIDILGSQWWILPLGLMAALATVGPFIFIYFERKAEDKLLGEQRRYQQTLKQASVGMTRIRNIRKLLDLITHIVTKTVRISYAAIYLYNKDTDEFLLQVSRDKGRIPVPKITYDNPLVAWINAKREPLIYEEIKRQMEDTRNETFRLLEENMRLLTATVLIPSFLEDSLMGFIVLGDKISGQIYSPDDLNVFQILASQAALAIENAQFYDQTKEMQEQIAQAEKMATIGTMADGLSHQINNRFYALSLIAGDTIDSIKLTDTSKCTPEVKEMIESINHALERIQSNVTKGGEVVRGLLKYSRKGDTGFEALDLNEIINNTLEMVQYKVKLSEIDIIRNYNSIPAIKGNMAQLEEVFFNFIDNAYDSTVERRNLLKEEGYRGKITISAKPKENTLEITVQDNGMGIKDEQADKIFTPFFTTKTSSRKGTGLGLYVIRRIITDTHKGKVSFESQYKAGTRFIIELPIAK